ncbi:16S rRNA processing protein RimM [Catalinimonas alkaloidigena]|uniref:Ribosome maturation factor RimM n=1 Tax=Catalinimonas alkaloidigena TaxID=1075417 RepID=A0A1G9M2D8_9BACT|nr:ribosome maturation factor RimM [Catalinimonas alkaloidigena]SDL68442.1 16S rRNA processing protein RimM [Catalinimonas alkaloidigena]
MNPEECFLLGTVRKPHGLRGELSIFLDVDDPGRYEHLESVLVELRQEDGSARLIPFFVESMRLTGPLTLMRLEGLGSLEEAEPFRGARLFLPLEALPPLKGDQFYYHEILGFRIVDEAMGPLGEITDVYELPAQDLIVMQYRESEILIPIQDEVVKGVDRTKRELYCHLPDGLLDIYLNS